MNIHITTVPLTIYLIDKIMHLYIKLLMMKPCKGNISMKISWTHKPDTETRKGEMYS